MVQQAEREELVTMLEACRMLNASWRTVRARIAELGWTVYRHPLDNRKRMLRRADVEALMAAAGRVPA